jgi:hypothetical protein
MKKITNRSVSLCVLLLMLLSGRRISEGTIPPGQMEWVLANLLEEKSKGIQIKGNPRVINSPYGKAVYFNGVTDALFLEEMPLKALKEFTVEMIFCPDTLAPFEQRPLHIGEITGDRMLIEIRAVDSTWYLDGFVASTVNKKALIDDCVTHPLGKWYHVALVVGPERLTTFVNRKQELSEPFSFAPIESGRSSIGVRQNEKSWFKGMIYKVRITPKLLKPDDFMIN